VSLGSFIYKNQNIRHGQIWSSYGGMIFDKFSKTFEKHLTKVKMYDIIKKESGIWKII